jgi:GTP-binding protein
VNNVITFLKLNDTIKMTLEQAMEFIDDDELVEVTPLNVRVRKKLLTEMDRKRANRGGNKED